MRTTAKYRIFTVGLELPGDAFEYVEFDSDQTLLDADIILFQPTLGDCRSDESYNGKRLLNKISSFWTKQHLDHWLSEIVAAVTAGKLVIVYLARPIQCYRYTGEQEFSGTGRSRVTTDMVDEISSYEAVPNLEKVIRTSGKQIRLEKGNTYLTPYWTEFSECSPYEVEIKGEFSEVLLKSLAGDRIVGAAVHRTGGALLFLPPLRCDGKKFTPGSDFFKGAIKFGKRLVAALVAVADNLKDSTQTTPEPDWAAESKYRLALESQLEISISTCAAEIGKLKGKKAELELQLREAGTLRRLLFEHGKPLEGAVLEALRVFGFKASPFEHGESRFDAVFVTPEGRRCLGEVEGRDNKAVDVQKFSQLERNIHEDLAREDVTECAKGVLFGNAYRLAPVSERNEFFTQKCISAAKRTGVALVRAPDLFQPAKYLKENPLDVDYARQCREAILCAEGEVVVFPAPPVSQAASLAERAQPEDTTKPSLRVNPDAPLVKRIVRSRKKPGKGDTKSS